MSTFDQSREPQQAPRVETERPSPAPAAPAAAPIIQRWASGPAAPATAPLPPPPSLSELTASPSSERPPSPSEMAYGPIVQRQASGGGVAAQVESLVGPK